MLPIRSPQLPQRRRLGFHSSTCADPANCRIIATHCHGCHRLPPREGLPVLAVRRAAPSPCAVTPRGWPPGRRARFPARGSAAAGPPRAGAAPKPPRGPARRRWGQCRERPTAGEVGAKGGWVSGGQPQAKHTKADRARAHRRQQRASRWQVRTPRVRQRTRRLRHSKAVF